MTRQLLACLLLSLLLIGAKRAIAGQIDTAVWSHVASITVNGAPQRGVIELALSPDVFDLAQPDLSDLRVTTARGDEIGYVVRPSGSTSTVQLTGGRLYNRSYLPGKQSNVTVDFGEPSLKNSLKIDTSGDNFRRMVRVDGSDDGRRWQVIREDGVLIRVTEGGSVAFNKDTVNIPDNNQRYLRITVLNAAGESGHIDIRAVNTLRLVPGAAETTPVAVISSTIAEKDATTILTLDLGYRNLPLWQVSVSPSDANFYRTVTVYGRNAAVRTVSVPVEDASPQTRTVEEPWEEITGGAIYRYPTGARQGASLTLNLGNARYRYLQLIIDNGNNSPLHLSSTAVTRLVYYVDFQPAAAAGYQLLLGNPKATLPSYDLPHYIATLRAEGVTPATLGPVTPNPAFTQGGKPTPWSEKHQALIWLALLAIFAILLALIMRQLRAVKATEAETGSEGHSE